MTGFARAEHTAGEVALQWELRSVNHRYLDIQFRMPDPLRALEADLRQVAAARLKRGKVEATLTVGREGGSGAVLDEARARQIIVYAERLADAIGRAGAINPVSILKWPGVLAEQPVDVSALGEPVARALASAADELAAMRAREGARLGELLEQRCEDILTSVSAVRARMPAVLDAIRQRLGERVAQLATGVEPERLEQELVLIAQKLDVSEELDRLEGHVAEIRATFDASEAVGRRLDFLMQELNREANTLASKSADGETTKHAVDLKVYIEQMREQVQNIE